MNAFFGLWAMDSAPVDDRELQAAMRLLGSSARMMRVNDVILASANQPSFRDESRDQPVVSNSLTVVADCRLDNADELVPSDGAARSRHHSRLIADTWHRHGTDTADRLLGDFALALFDQRRHQLFLARDPVGVRPLFYYATAGWIAFASTIELALALPGVPRIIDEAEVASNLIDYRTPSRDRTYFRGVYKLKPGHWLKVEDGRLITRCYWEPVQHDRHAGLDLHQAAEGLLAELERSVLARIQTQKPVGSHISGGLDSSALGLLGEAALRRQGRTLAAGYSWSPESEDEEALPLADERHRVAAFAAGLSAPMRYISATADDIDTALRINPGFAPGPLFPPEVKVLEQARRDDIGVLISGWGGDEAASFNGRGYLAWLLVTGQMTGFLRAIRMRSRGNWRSALRITREEAIAPLIPGHWRYQMELERVRRVVPHLAHPSLIAATRGQRARRRLPSTRPGVFQTQRELIRFGHLNQRMEDWYWLGRRVGVVHVYPLLDRRLLEFIFGLAPRHFSAERHSRELFCRAVDRFLPESLPRHRFKHETARPRRMAQNQMELVRARSEEWMSCREKADWLNHDLMADSIRKTLETRSDDLYSQLRLARLLAARRLVALC